MIYGPPEQKATAPKKYQSGNEKSKENDESIFDAFVETIGRFIGDDGTARATWTLVCVVLLQLLMMIRQDRILHDSMNVADRAARAAEISAKAATSALTDLERPWIFVQGAHIARRENPTEGIIPNFYWIHFRCKNVGRAPAIMGESLIFCRDRAELTATPDYSGQSLPIIWPLTIEDGIEFESSQFGPASQPRNTPASDVITYVIYGRLTYTSLNGDTHHTGFAIEVSPHMPAFQLCGDKAYNYYK